MNVDLGSAMSISRVVVKHAGSGGEASDLNAVDFTVKTRVFATSSWVTRSTVTGNGSDVTVHEFAPVNARYVQVHITDASDTSDPSARIYEIEVYE